MLPLLTTSRTHLSLKGWEECAFWTWEWKVNWLLFSISHRKELCTAQISEMGLISWCKRHRERANKHFIRENTTLLINPAVGVRRIQFQFLITVRAQTEKERSFLGQGDWQSIPRPMVGNESGSGGWRLSRLWLQSELDRHRTTQTQRSFDGNLTKDSAWHIFRDEPDHVSPLEKVRPKVSWMEGF